MGRTRVITAVAATVTASLAVAVAQEQPTTQGREGPEVQAEAQDVPGGLEPAPSTDFDPTEHLLGDLFGIRSQLAECGISIDPEITTDFAANFRGGNDTSGSAFLHVFNLYLTVQTEPLFGHPGGTFYADLLTQHGQSPSDEAGDYALLDELDYGGRTQISEMWFEQKLLHDVLRIKVGKIDVNTEFCLAQNSLDFSNGGINYAFPVTQFNFMPTAPDPAAGALAFAYPNKHFYAGVGVFDGALQEGFAGDYGPSTLFGAPADLYLVAEVGVNFSPRGLPCRAAVGVTRHTGDFTEFDGGGTQDGNTAFYALLDATLWKECPGDEDDEQGVGAFFVYDTADSDVTEVDQHFAGGLAWTGALPGRDHDAIGVGASYSHFSSGAGFQDTGE